MLDFATSRVAQGKMRVAHNKGEQVRARLPDRRARRARPTDPGVVVVPQRNGLFGALMTFGEHKGYGMAVACELLGGALTGGGTWHRPADSARAVLNGMLTILIDPAKLGTQASFEQEALAFVDWLRAEPAGRGLRRACRSPASRSARARAARERDGIWLDDATWAEIVAAGREGRRRGLDANLFRYETPALASAFGAASRRGTGC